MYLQSSVQSTKKLDELANITHQLRDDCNSSSSSDDYFAEKLISIPKPSKNQESYVNRKGYHSLLLQCVALPDKHSLLLQCVALPDKSFSYIYCGEPGSLHDSRVLRKSPLYRRAEDRNFWGKSFQTVKFPV
ncbi:DDE superfamily endonuclease [Popillia japonica]|uniref:DDE superfamily endonuclease n=1 Tax=Popillia japonica TaxID=7064 RepID=A0AAW1IWG2_POPJA